VSLADDPSIDGVAMTTAPQTFTITVGSRPEPPVLSIRQDDDPLAGRVIVVTWPESGPGTLVEPILESAPTPAGPWTPVEPGDITLTAGVHEYRLPLAGAPERRFFHLAY
jgi:hypothetical protein